MAKMVRFEEQNSNTGNESPAPLYRDGGKTVACFALTPEEIMEVMNTGRVWVINPGPNFPGTTISGSYPFDKQVN